jgi:hypothetical protein
LIRGPRVLEGSTRMALEWDNFRAAHLWSLAQGDLDLAERLVVSSFDHAVFSMRQEHASMVERTVELGDELDRPSTKILGMLSYWLDIQGNEQESRRVAQRGIDAALSPDHPSTAICWFEFAGATASVAARSAEALNAFEHQAAAVANTPDLDLNWPALAYLTDASLHADPSATPALRQRLSDIAARVKSPWLTMTAHQFEGHVCLTASPPDYAGAITAYGRMADVDHAVGDPSSQGVALRCLAMASIGLGAPDALARCHDALDALFEIRYWQKIRQTLESVALALANAGRTEHAAAVVGHLDSHAPGLGLEHDLQFRERARALINADGGHAAALLQGAQMSPEELVTNALVYCSTDSANLQPPA